MVGSFNQPSLEERSNCYDTDFMEGTIDNWDEHGSQTRRSGTFVPVAGRPELHGNRCKRLNLQADAGNGVMSVMIFGEFRGGDPRRGTSWAPAHRSLFTGLFNEPDETRGVTFKSGRELSLATGMLFIGSYYANGVWNEGMVCDSYGNVCIEAKFCNRLSQGTCQILKEATTSPHQDPKYRNLLDPANLLPHLVQTVIMAQTMRNKQLRRPSSARNHEDDQVTKDAAFYVADMLQQVKHSVRNPSCAPSFGSDTERDSIEIDDGVRCILEGHVAGMAFPTPDAAAVVFDQAIMPQPEELHKALRLATGVKDQVEAVIPRATPKTKAQKKRERQQARKRGKQMVIGVPDPSASDAGEAAGEDRIATDQPSVAVKSKAQLKRERQRSRKQAGQNAQDIFSLP